MNPKKDNMKLCLYALTGFGNGILRQAVNMSNIEDIIVFTRSEPAEFPHYECENLRSFCQRMGIISYDTNELNDIEQLELMTEFSPDLLIVATYHKKIPDDILAVPRYKAINIHPSLLPAYRGPTPTNWTIINGEEKTGITFHYLSQKFDSGDILFQNELSVKNFTDGELRKQLATLAENEFEKFIQNYTNSKLTAIRQNKREGSYYPKITSRAGKQLLKSGQFDPDNINKGLTPYPGVENFRKEYQWDTKVTY